MSHILKIAFILLIATIPLIGYTQTWDETRKNLIYNATQYRKHLMLKDTASLKKVQVLIKKARDLEPDKETSDDILFNINFAINCRNNKFKEFKKLSHEYYPESEYLKQFNIEDYHTIKDNHALLDLIITGLYNDNYPYKIARDTELYKELEFYNIQTNDTIAEIGAGNGSFSKLLFLTGYNTPILINELKFSNYEYINKSIDQLSKLYGQVKMKAVKGRKKNAKLPYKVNKIIIRRTYHHFTHRAEMLSSLSKSLTDDGDLYVYESPSRDSISYCPMLMSEQDIIQTIESNNFSLQDRLDLKRHIVFRFRKNK